jgi:hypothetical protein
MVSIYLGGCVMARLLVLTLLLVLPAAAAAGMERFREQPRQVRLFTTGGAGPEYRDYPRKYSIGMNVGGELAYTYGLFTFGFSFGSRLGDRAHLISHFDLRVGMGNDAGGLATESGPRIYLHYNEYEGAYVDLRMALALYLAPVAGWATAFGMYVGGGYELGSHWARGFADIGARVMMPLDSGASGGWFSEMDEEEQARHARRARSMATMQAMVRIGVRFYFR